MAKSINLSNFRFNNLTVIEKTGLRDSSGHILWKCLCSCGNITYAPTGKLKSEKIKSCGCASKSSKKHGMSNIKIYDVWFNMKNRCRNPNHPYYKYYGGRGIIVCDEWLNDFCSFYNWAMANGYVEDKLKNGKNKLTIDRINNDGDYCPENCRWVTMSEQHKNKRHPTKRAT